MRRIGPFPSALLLATLALGCSEPHYVIGQNGEASGAAGAGGERACPPECTRGCSGEVCEVEPFEDGTLPTCPDSFDCVVHCEEPGACVGAVRCGRARHCTVRCSGEDNCNGGVGCDDAQSCEVDCSGTGSCSSLDCSRSGVCNVSCTGANSCQGEIACGAGACGVLCRGTRSCPGGSSCAGSCACNWQCEAGAGCFERPPICPTGCETSTGCSSTAPGCQTCR